MVWYSPECLPKKCKAELDELHSQTFCNLRSARHHTANLCPFCANVPDSPLGFPIGSHGRNPGWCGIPQNASPKMQSWAWRVAFPCMLEITIGSHTANLCPFCANVLGLPLGIPIGSHGRNPGWFGINQNVSPKNAKCWTSFNPNVPKLGICMDWVSALPLQTSCPIKTLLSWHFWELGWCSIHQNAFSKNAKLSFNPAWTWHLHLQSRPLVQAFNRPLVQSLIRVLIKPVVYANLVFWPQHHPEFLFWLPITFPSDEIQAFALHCGAKWQSRATATLGILISSRSWNPGWCGIYKHASQKNAKLSLTCCILKHVEKYDQHSHCMQTFVRPVRMFQIHHLGF